MKKIILAVFCLVLLNGVATSAGPMLPNETKHPFLSFEIDIDGDKDPIRIYPNPAIEYIRIANGDKVKRLVVYNILGRKVKEFKVAYRGQKYYLDDLYKGIYLVQLFDEKEEILYTQRLHLLRP